jgi:hypothetical protein
MPKPKRVKSMAIWDRLELDAAFEALTSEEPCCRLPSSSCKSVDSVRELGTRRADEPSSPSAIRFGPDNGHRSGCLLRAPCSEDHDS